MHNVLVIAGSPKTVFTVVNDDVWRSTDDWTDYGYLYRSDDGGDSWRKFWRELGEVSSVLWVPQ